MKITKIIIFFFIMLLSIFLVSAIVTPPSNLNGYNQFTISGYTSIRGTSIYQNGNAVLDNTSSISSSDWIGIINISKNYIYNNSGVLSFNETKLNSTTSQYLKDNGYNKTSENDLRYMGINTVMNWLGMTSLSNIYIYNDSGVLSFNETKLNSTTNQYLKNNGYNITTQLKTYFDTIYNTNVFNQVLNTTSNVQFNNMTISNTTFSNGCNQLVNSTGIFIIC